MFNRKSEIAESSGHEGVDHSHKDADIEADPVEVSPHSATGDEGVGTVFSHPPTELQEVVRVANARVENIETRRAGRINMLQSLSVHLLPLFDLKELPHIRTQPPFGLLSALHTIPLYRKILICEETGKSNNTVFILMRFREDETTPVAFGLSRAGEWIMIKGTNRVTSRSGYSPAEVDWKEYRRWAPDRDTGVFSIETLMEGVLETLHNIHGYVARLQELDEVLQGWEGELDQYRL